MDEKTEQYYRSFNSPYSSLLASATGFEWTLPQISMIIIAAYPWWGYGG